MHMINYILFASIFFFFLNFKYIYRFDLSKSLFIYYEKSFFKSIRMFIFVFASIFKKI